MIQILFRDALLIMLVVLVACIAFMIRYMADPTVTSHGQIDSPGSIVVTMDWDPGNDDVDLWLMGPGEKKPVYYDNKGGAVWDLLRDDMGTVNDATPVNYENAFTRGEPPGEYTVNVVCYRCKEILPVHVTVTIQERRDSGPLSTVATSRITLNRDGDQRTAIDFRVNGSGTIDTSTLNRLFRPLVKAAP